jgi:LacI family transcriptional regulator/LacI family repressor for deo operon, udp, cdd, tsx, nupC, and nupG
MARVTQKEIAAKLGLHPASVCLALKNSSSISEDTRALILKTAQALGYERDPMLGALAAYRRTTQPKSFRGVLGWIIDTGEGFDWSAIPEYRDYHVGAKARADELGYKLETFDLRSYKAASARLDKVLRSRNVRGVLVCPQPNAHTMLPIDFSELSAVAFGYTVRSPALHSVTSHHYQSVVEIFRRLRLRGYSRIGYAFTSGHDERLQRHPLSGFLTEQLTQPVARRIPPHTQDSCKAFRAWLRTYKPDAMITSRIVFPGFLEQLKVSVPARLGVAMIGVVDGWRQFSGIDEASREVGQVAADALVAMVERGEKGVPKRPRRVLVSASWVEGTSLRPETGFVSEPLSEPLLDFVTA